MVHRWWLRGLLAAVLILPGGRAPGAGGQGGTGFALVGRHDLGGRGMHAGLAIAGDCAYVGARGGDRGPLIVDIGEPAAPRLVGQVPPRPGSTPREVRAVADLDLLVVLNYRLDALSLSPNTLDLYDIGDCRAPILVGRLDFGDDLPHEFFLWRDPVRPARLLAYVAMWGYAPNLRVVDLTDPAAPTPVATWDAATALGVPSRLHSVTVTPDGARAYLADWDAGLMVLDTHSIAAGGADAGARLVALTPPGAALLLPGGNLHSAVPIPGRDLVVTTQEIYGPGACPYGRLHVVDVADPAAPVVVGAYGTPENDPVACPTTAGLDGAFSAHNPLVVADVAFVSWYAGGLRAVDLADPGLPRETGAFVPAPLPAVVADDPTLGSYPVRVWSSPIVRHGLVYVVDIRNGLSVLRYTGVHAARVAAVAFAEGTAMSGDRRTAQPGAGRREARQRARPARRASTARPPKARS